MKNGANTNIMKKIKYEESQPNAVLLCTLAFIAGTLLQAALCLF